MLTALPLYPLLYTQGLWVAARALRLPEPDGPRQGRVGRGPGLRLLILGDSSAAGVGVAHQDQALAGHLPRMLAQGGAVDWVLHAKSGATTGSTLETMARLDGTFDVALVALGVNDVKNGVRFPVWQRNIARLLDRLRSQHGCDLVVMSGIPPIDRFPLLPNPLRAALAARARQFDQALFQTVSETDGAVFLRTHLDGLVAHMAEDGFHPGPEIYRQWAADAATAIRAHRPADLQKSA